MREIIEIDMDRLKESLIAKSYPINYLWIFGDRGRVGGDCQYRGGRKTKMKATVCDRCGKVVPLSCDEEYFLELEILMSSDCELIGISERSEIELCGDCTKKFAKFMKGKRQ